MYSMVGMGEAIFSNVTVNVRRGDGVWDVEGSWKEVFLVSSPRPT